MAVKFRNNHIIHFVITIIFILFLSIPIYKYTKIEKTTALLPQDTANFIFPIEYERIPFRWGIDMPLLKANDFNPSTNYWVSQKNPNIVLAISTNSKAGFFYTDELLKKADYPLPDLSPENISEIALARYSYQNSLKCTDKQQIYWDSSECAYISLTESEIIQLAELILPKALVSYTDYFSNINSTATTEFPKLGEPYLWHFRLYFDNCEGIYYDPCVYLQHTSDNRYFLSYDNQCYIFVPDEINQKLQIIFENTDFGFNTDKLS